RAELVGGHKQLEDIALLGDVAFHRDRLAVLALDFGNDLLRRRLVTGVTDNHAKAARRGGDGGGAADAATAAGDNNNLVRHISPHKSTRFDPPLATQASNDDAGWPGDDRKSGYRFSEKVMLQPIKSLRDPAPAAPDLPGFP